MPDAPTPRKITVPDFVAAKSQGKRLSVVTAYDALWGGIADEAGVDAILVGDSLGMVVQGKSTTLPVTLDQMIYHGEMVARTVKRALVIVDLPFMTYQVSPRQAVKSAGRIIKETGADCVKLEGGVHQAETIAALVAADLPVMAHVGMRPQAVRRLGRMSKIQRDEAALLADAKAAEEAGAFGIVLELIASPLAGRITRAISIPTIGIGAGVECDGQVLVGPDMLGLTTFHAKYVRKFAELRETAIRAIADYSDAVHRGEFPGAEHSHT
jgi:3-methyl-2-oxobutanoate hydroxymethyltransferase